jgi:hypothetical protein
MHQNFAIKLTSFPPFLPCPMALQAFVLLNVSLKYTEASAATGSK